jgi:hypothetical protein
MGYSMVLYAIEENLTEYNKSQLKHNIFKNCFRMSHKFLQGLYLYSIFSASAIISNLSSSTGFAYINTLGTIQFS